MIPTEAVGIALDDTRLLADVCGVNDYNLRVLERLMGVRVFVRGNELRVESNDPCIRDLFSALVTQVVDV